MFTKYVCYTACMAAQWLTPLLNQSDREDQDSIPREGKLTESCLKMKTSTAALKAWSFLIYVITACSTMVAHILDICLDDDDEETIRLKTVD